MLCSFEDENVRKTLNIYSPKKKNHFPKLFHLFDKKIEKKNNNNNQVTHVCFTEKSDSTK